MTVSIPNKFYPIERNNKEEQRTLDIGDALVKDLLQVLG